MSTPDQDAGPILPNALEEELRVNASSSGQLRIGKQGVYLIDRGERVTSFELIGWEQLTKTIESS